MKFFNKTTYQELVSFVKFISEMIQILLCVSIEFLRKKKAYLKNLYYLHTRHINVSQMEFLCKQKK